MMDDEQSSPEFQQRNTGATSPTNANIIDNNNNNNNNNEIVSKIVKQPGWRKRSSLIQVAAGQQTAPSTQSTSAASSDKDHNNNNNNLNNLNNNNNQNDNNLNNNLNNNTAANNNNNNNKSDEGSVASSGVANSSGGGGTDASKSNSNNKHHHHNNVNPFNIKNLFASTLAPSSSPPQLQLQPQSQPPSTSLHTNSDSLTSNNHSKDGPENYKSAISSESSTGEPVPVLDLEQNNLLDRVKSDTSVSSNGPLKDFILQQPSHIKHNPRIHFKIDDALAKQALEISNKFAEMSVREPSLTSLNSARLIPTVYHSENNKLYFKSKSTLKNCPLDRVGGFRLNSNLNIKVFERSKSADDELSSELSHGARSPDETEIVGARLHSSVDSVKLRKSQTSLRSVKSGAKSKTKYKIKLKTKSNCHSIRIVPQKQSPPSTLQQDADCHNSTNNNNNSDCDSDRKRASSPKSGPNSNSNSANAAAAAASNASPNSSSSPLSFSSLMDKFGFNNANNKSK